MLRKSRPGGPYVNDPSRVVYESTVSTLYMVNEANIKFMWEKLKS